MKYTISTSAELKDVFENIEEKYSLKDIFVSGMSFYGFVNDVKAALWDDRVDFSNVDQSATITVHVPSIEHINLFEDCEVGDGYPYETFGLIQLNDGSSIQLMSNNDQ